MQIDLSGKNVIVTGASSGMGAAAATLLAGAGANVALVGRDEARLNAVRDQADAAGSGTALAIVADLEQVEPTYQAIDAAIEAFGAIDALILAAGVYESAPVTEETLESFERQMAINVRSPYLMAQRVVPHLRDNGSIIFFSSTVAHAGFPGCAAYTATKGAIEAMARSFAAELAPRVRVNVIAPGFVLTPMVTNQIDAAPAMESWLVDNTPTGFVGSAEDIAGTVAFLISDAANYMHGAIVTLDGGWSTRARGT